MLTKIKRSKPEMKSEQFSYLNTEVQRWDEDGELIDEYDEVDIIIPLSYLYSLGMDVSSEDLKKKRGEVRVIYDTWPIDTKLVKGGVKMSELLKLIKEVERSTGEAVARKNMRKALGIGGTGTGVDVF